MYTQIDYKQHSNLTYISIPDSQFLQTRDDLQCYAERGFVEKPEELYPTEEIVCVTLMSYDIGFGSLYFAFDPAGEPLTEPHFGTAMTYIYVLKH